MYGSSFQHIAQVFFSFNTMLESFRPEELILNRTAGFWGLACPNELGRRLELQAFIRGLFSAGATDIAAG